MRTKVAVALALVVTAVITASATVAEGARTSQAPPNVLVTQRLVGHVFFTEGSVGYVRILDRSGKRIAERAFGPDSPSLSFSLGTGRYRLVSYQRACDGNCSNLSPPLDVCSKRFRVRGDAFVAATVRVAPSSGCRIRVRSY